MTFEELTKDIPERVSCTINVSLTPRTIMMIKLLCRLKIYVSQSEVLRVAINRYLKKRIWGRITPTLAGFFSRE